jgi:hypothetical protein
MPLHALGGKKQNKKKQKQMAPNLDPTIEQPNLPLYSNNFLI